MKFGLANNIIEEIQQVLETNPRIDKGIIFGSRAKGNFKDGSDIDIAIKGENMKLDDLLALEAKLDDLDLPYNIDLINYSDIKEPALTEHIDRVGIEFYSSWKEWKFSQFVEINPTIKLIGDKQYSFVEMKDLQDSIKICAPSTKRRPSGGARFQERDTLFARITPCLENGKICQVHGLDEGVGFGSTEFLVFRGKEDISDTDFIYYLSRWEEVREFAERNFVGTSGRQRVPKDCFDNLSLLLPPLKEQKAIATVLNSLDDKIDLFRRQNKTLESIADVLFRQWFVEEKQEDWKEQKLGDLETITSSKRIFFSEYVPFGIPFFRSKEIIELRNTGTTKSELYISVGKFNEINNKFGSPGEGDILLTSVGTLGVAYLVRESDRFYFKDGNLTWFKNFKEIPGSIIYLWLISTVGQDALAAITIGSTQEALTIEKLKSISLKIPPKEKVIMYDEQFKKIIYKIEQNQLQINKLSHLRDTLLPKLLSGEARVKMP